VGHAQSRSAINDLSEPKQVVFFPNPATSFIQFDFSENISSSATTFRIYNFIGKKVYETSRLNPRMVINLNDFFRGVYIFQLIDRQGKIIESSKFQVQK
jgi:hypothetical protein